MKIYNEVIIDMNTGDTIYEDSFEYYGPLAMCGGDDSSGRVAADGRMGTAAKTTMSLLRKKYDSLTSGDSFFDREKIRFANEASGKKSDAVEEFNQKKQQLGETHTLTSAQGARSQQSVIADQTAQINRSREDAILKAQEIRDSNAESSFAEMDTTMAGGGGRRKKMMGKKLTAAMAVNRKALKDSVEVSKMNVASAEEKMQMETTASAMNTQQGKDSARLNMDQTRRNIDRNIKSENARLDQAISEGTEGLQMEASGLVSSTVASFTDSSSTWDNRVPGTEYDGGNWKDKFGI